MIRNLCVAAILLLPGTVFCQSATWDNTAEHMVSACREVPDAPTRMNNGVLEARIPDSYDVGWCVGAFASIHAAITYDVQIAPFLRVCAPIETSRLQVIAIFMRYARSHPEKLHRHFFRIAWEALAEAFPCEATTDSFIPDSKESK